jgi:hypothetical protein
VREKSIEGGTHIYEEGQVMKAYERASHLLFGSSGGGSSKEVFDKLVAEKNGVAAKKRAEASGGSASSASAEASANKTGDDNDGEDSKDQEEAELLATIEPMEIQLKGREACLREARAKNEKKGGQKTGKKGEDGAAAKKKARKALHGGALDRALVEARRIIGIAKKLQQEVLQCDGLESLKQLDGPLKDSAAKAKDKADLFYDAGGDQEAAEAHEAHELIQFINKTKELLRTWKSYTHSFSQKSRGQFETAWKEMSSRA